MAETGLADDGPRLDFSDEVATFGDRITHAREVAGLGQDALALRMGVRMSMVRAWEEDRREPRGNQLQMLAGMLNVSIRWLLTGLGDEAEAREEDVDQPDLSAVDLTVADLRITLDQMAVLRVEMLALAQRMGHLEQQLRLQLREPQ